MILKENNGLFVRIPKTGSTSIVSAITGVDHVEGAPLRHRVKAGEPEFYKERASSHKNVSRYISLFPGWDSGALMHAPYSVWEEEHPEVKDIFTFTFVRNPWDWLISQYEFIKKTYWRRIMGMGAGTAASKHKNAELREKLSEMLVFFGTSYKGFMLDRDSMSFNSYIEHYFSTEGDNKTQSYFIKNCEGVISVDYIGKTESIQEGLDFIFEQTGIERRADKTVNSTKKKGARADYFQSSQIRKIVEGGMSEDIERFQYEFDR